MFITVILGLLVCTEARGSITETLFVQTGKDLLLDVKESVVIKAAENLFWKVNVSTSIGILLYDGTTFIFESHTGRAEFSAQTHSLLLKNVQKFDSGDYTAVVSGVKDQPVAKYKVTVQDPVSPVKLTVTSSSSESCNLTVTCSTVDAHISSTFTCDNKTCSEEGGERSEATTRPPSITVYLERGLITCNHSNHVSLEQDKREINSFCKPPPGSEGVSVCLLKTVVLSVGLIIMVSVVISVHLMLKLKKRQ